MPVYIWSVLNDNAVYEEESFCFNSNTNISFQYLIPIYIYFYISTNKEEETNAILTGQQRNSSESMGERDGDEKEKDNLPSSFLQKTIRPKSPRNPELVVKATLTQLLEE